MPAYIEPELVEIGPISTNSGRILVRFVQIWFSFGKRRQPLTKSMRPIKFWPRCVKFGRIRSAQERPGVGGM